MTKIIFKICNNYTTQIEILSNLTIFIYFAYFEFSCYLLFINPERIVVERFRCCNKAFLVFASKCLCIISLIIHQSYLFCSFINNIFSDKISFDVSLAALTIVVMIINLNYIINRRISILPIPYYGDRLANYGLMWLLNGILFFGYYFYIYYECKSTSLGVYLFMFLPNFLYLSQNVYIFSGFIGEHI